jgi:hypothetical protein
MKEKMDDTSVQLEDPNKQLCHIAFPEVTATAVLCVLKESQYIQAQDGTTRFFCKVR